MSGVLVFVVAAQGTSLDHLVLVTGVVVSIPRSHKTVAIEGTACHAMNLPQALHRQRTEVH